MADCSPNFSSTLLRRKAGRSSVSGNWEQGLSRLPIALVHELLYQSENPARVPMASYIETLINQLSSTFGSYPQIEYITECDDTELDVTSATPCGIILNELITNAPKRAPKSKG